MSQDIQLIKSLFSQIDVIINGDRPWDIKVHNDKFYRSLLTNAELAFGETYMAKWWDCDQLDELMYRIQKADLEKIALSQSAFWKSLFAQKLFNFFFRHINFQTPSKSLIVGKKHYSVGNDLFKFMLDERMNYSCAMWDKAKDLNEAQENKLRVTCKKLALHQNLSVLDVGCGWGSFAKYAAQNYGVKVDGITISQAQFEFAKQNCAGLPVEIKFQDYRELINSKKKFDRIVSIGMFEHVGNKNYVTYMKAVANCLKEDGIFLLHTIVGNSYKGNSQWINTYIFPYGEIPTLAQIAKAAEDVFIVEACQNYGPNYDKTLMAWHHNINQHWHELTYDETFQRMWNYYLLSCAGNFRARQNQVWQIVFTKHGLEKGFHFR